MANRGARRSGRPPDYTWQGPSTGLVASTVGATQALLGTLVSFAATGTVIRLRGHINVGMDVAAADNAMVMAVGIIVATDDAIAAGAASLPSPFDDADSEWLWHGYFALKSITGTQSDTIGGQFVQREIDSKAMRRVKPGYSLAVIADGSVLLGSPTADVVMAARVLFAS